MRRCSLPVVVGIAEAAQAAMRTTAKEAMPNETGGVLIGVLVDGHPVITHAVEIPPHKPARTGFVIDVGKTRKAVEAAAAADPRVGYLGEWHSHPMDQGPSPTDRTTMQRLASDNDTGDPVLVVVRPEEGSAQRLDVYTVQANQLVSATVETVGGLPTPEGRSSE